MQAVKVRSLDLLRKKRGLFIVVEGLDGCGKSTMARSLAEHFNARQLTTSASRFGDAREALEQAVASDPVARQMLFATSVAIAAREIRELRAQGESVVLDRYWLSTLVYGQVIRKIDLRLDVFEDSLERPDVTFFLDAPASVRAARLRRRSATGEVNLEDWQTLEADRDGPLRAGFIAGLKRSIAGTGVVLDASGDDPQQVFNAARAEADRLQLAA